MRKTIINVPKGIKYLSDWSEFCLPEKPTIIDKQITGCGFTEYCLSNNQNVVLCSPRRILLENKEEQHKPKKDKDGNLILPIPMPVYYAKNEFEKVLDVDKDLSFFNIPSINSTAKELKEEDTKKITKAVMDLKNGVRNYTDLCKSINRPCKILVTYDSFRHVKEALGSDIQYFNVVIDEFQVIFGDGKFKSTTELEFLTYLVDLQKVCFVSATPMMEEFLDELDEFKDLPYYILDWGAEDPSRVTKPYIEYNYTNSILTSADKIVKSYLNGDYEKYAYLNQKGDYNEIISKEVVIYVNSVKNICDIIKRNDLSFENTNVLCSRNNKNKRKIRSAFKLKKDDLGGIGKVPEEGEAHKMFTLCTRTVYLGADFYSTCARTVILSDSNIDCMAADITLDLPQILGRQRNEMNPWKNRAELYFRTTLVGNKVGIEEFKSLIESKKKMTENLLCAYNNSFISSEVKHDLAVSYKKLASTYNYKDNYVAVNEHIGSDLVPVFNNLVLIAEIRSFQIQQIDYADRFTVRNCLNSINGSGEFNDEVKSFLKQFNELTSFLNKMKYLCNFKFTRQENLLTALNNIPMIYSNYFSTIGPNRIIALGCQKSKLDLEYQDNYKCQEDELAIEINKNFKEGEKYTLKYIKKLLKEIYTKLNIYRTPKATDLEDFFEIRNMLVRDKKTNRRNKGMELLSKKL